jgi:hypothetical protein
MPCPSNLRWFHRPNNKRRGLPLMNLLILSFVKIRVISFLLRLTVFLSTPFLNLLSLCLSLIVTDLVLLPRNRRSYISIYFKLYVLRVANWQTRTPRANGGRHSLNICTARNTNIIDGIRILELVEEDVRISDVQTIIKKCRSSRKITLGNKKSLNVNN